MKHNVNLVTSEAQFKALIKATPVTVINCFAPWHQACVDMNTVFEELSRKYPKLEVEDFSDLAETYNVETVPTFILLLDGVVKETIEGPNAPYLTQIIQTNANYSASVTQQRPIQTSDSNLKALINSYPVMVFMKGSPSAPRCGFSRTLVEILTEINCTYGSFDILSDESIREALKVYSDWPTFPQVYVDGELVGGLDIVKEMVATGEFQELVKEEPLEDRLRKLVSREPVMLFMKGDPMTPRCGFSRKIVALLQQHEVKFGTFDILEDEEIRAGLKEYSDWPTFPQLYIKGELIGGLDIVQQMVDSGEFKPLVQ